MTIIPLVARGDSQNFVSEENVATATTCRNSNFFHRKIFKESKSSPFRIRIVELGCELILRLTVIAASGTGALKKSDLKHETVGTTVREGAVT